METSVTAARALGAYTARKTLRVVTWVALAIILGLLALVAFLAIKFSAWWWIFALPIVIVTVVLIIARFFTSRVIGKVYRHPFTSKQRESLETFSDDLRGALTSLPISPQLLAMTTLREVITKREAPTLSKIISETKGLKDSFDNLQSYFGER